MNRHAYDAGSTSCEIDIHAAVCGCVKALIQAEAHFHDGHQNINRYGNPNLRLHCVLRVTKKGFDPQVLLYPFEEKFNMPSAFVKIGDCRRLK